MRVIIRKFLWGLLAVWNDKVAVVLDQWERFGLRIFIGLFSSIDVLVGALNLGAVLFDQALKG
jgi:hypothetical protein